MMLNVLIAPETMLFSAALILMLAIGVIEAVGLGASAAHVDLQADLDHGGVFSWLGFGRVPLLILLIAFLACFGVIGLLGQQVVAMIGGSMLPAWIAGPTALVAALPTTGLAARALARVMPHDETTAYEVEDLVGRTGVVTIGRAAAGSPARVRVVDPHGQPHHLLVEPNDPAKTFAEGDTILLVRREGESFRAVLHDSPRLSNWID